MLTRIADYLASRLDKENDLILLGLIVFKMAVFLGAGIAYLTYHQSVMPIK
jgi:hypothetical protein